MKTISVKAPAKINLTLEILSKRVDGFHEIKSIMQSINLFDVLDFELSSSGTDKNIIVLSGNSREIPYDNTNLVSKIANKYFELNGIKGAKLTCNINKKIPVSAGLAGGSTDASATVFALCRLFNQSDKDIEIQKLLSSCGSDLNFCFSGGCAFCEGRGEKITKLPPLNLKLNLIKPKNISVSAKEAYEAFSKYSNGHFSDGIKTDKLKALILNEKFDKNFIVNDLQNPVVKIYPKLKNLSEKFFMSGSGSAFFTFENDIEEYENNPEFEVFKGLETISYGAG